MGQRKDAIMFVSQLSENTRKRGMNVNEFKAGDKIYFQGDQGKVMKVTYDCKEPLLEVALTNTRVTYLNPSQLDLYPLPDQLNENQQIVLEWLKNEYTGDADPFGILAFLFSQAPKSEVTIASLELTRAEQAQLLQAFSQWVLEQEEGNG